MKGRIADHLDEVFAKRRNTPRIPVCTGPIEPLILGKNPTTVLVDEMHAFQAEKDELLSRFPEINFSNYGQDQVEALQAWAFEAYDLRSRGVK